MYIQNIWKKHVNEIHHSFRMYTQSHAEIPHRLHITHVHCATMILSYADKGSVELANQLAA